jgi:hypothetical protein
MRRTVLDSNAVDPLIDLPGAHEAVRAAVDAGQAELLFTHVNIEELAAVPNLDRRSRLLLILVDIGRLVPTGAFACDVSRLSFARLSEDVDVIEALRSGNVDHSGRSHCCHSHIRGMCFGNQREAPNGARS